MNYLIPEYNNLKKLTVLYVEDDEDIRKLNSRLLNRHVGKLITANNGKSGLEEFRLHSPDIVITDILMPEMDGLAMAEEIRRLKRTVPVIVTTAFEQTDYLIRSIDIGVDKYVTKPVAPDRLLDALRECAHRLHADEQISLAAKVFDSSLDAIGITDAGGITISINRAFAEMTGYAADEVVDRQIYLFSPGQYDAALHEDIRSEISEKGLWRGELWAKRKNGDIYPEWMEVTALTDNEGRITHYIYVSSDITERKHAEELLAMEERIRLARDLHDGMLQSLTASALQLQVIYQQMETNPRDARNRLADIRDYITATQRDMRIHIQELKKPPSLDAQASLKDRLMELVEKTRRNWSLNVEMDIQHLEAPVSPQISQQIYYIILEALTNAGKHAAASTVRVDLTGEGDQAQIVVADNGRGFPFHGRYDDTSLTLMGAGPVTLQERVASLRGKLILESDDKGSRLEINIPLGKKGDMR